MLLGSERRSYSSSLAPQSLSFSTLADYLRVRQFVLFYWLWKTDVCLPFAVTIPHGIYLSPFSNNNKKSEFLFTTCRGPHLQHDELDPAPWLMRTTAGTKKKCQFFLNDVCGSNESWINQISEQTRTCTSCTGRLLEVGRAPKTRFIRFRSTNSTK